MSDEHGDFDDLIVEAYITIDEEQWRIVLCDFPDCYKGRLDSNGDPPGLKRGQVCPRCSGSSLRVLPRFRVEDPLPELIFASARLDEIYAAEDLVESETPDDDTT